MIKCIIVYVGYYNIITSGLFETLEDSSYGLFPSNIIIYMHLQPNISFSGTVTDWQGSHRNGGG